MEDLRTESQIHEEAYVFCEENISSYEKTIYILAIAYGSEPVLRLNKDDIYKLACLLEVDSELLCKAIVNKVSIPCENAIIRFGNDIVECGSYLKNDFFYLIINVFLTYKNLDALFDGTDEEEIIENISIFNTLNSLFEISNAISSSYECMHKNAFSYDYAMYDTAECFYPKSYINMLYTLISIYDSLEFDSRFASIITMLLKYEFYTRVNALYLVTICQILKHSPCFDDEQKQIANDIYNKLLQILKNGKVISISINMLFLEKDKPADKRSRNDNTTRLQLLYGYSNYDCYDLRLDFAHKGQELVHFNNQTPGGLSCCIFTQDKYQSVVNQYPELAECFISYENQWALKEKINCELSNEMMSLYEEVSKVKSHDPVFSKIYSEKAINDFINTVAKMLPNECRRAIDTDGTHSKYCFNYDIIIRDITLLYIAYLSKDEVETERLFNLIADRAYSYGLISEKTKFYTFEKVYEIAEKAREKIIHY